MELDMKDIEAAVARFNSFDYIPVGLCVLSNEYTVLYWNK
jgi:hypothetical protein